jgi:hypothetical protein
MNIGIGGNSYLQTSYPSAFANWATAIFAARQLAKAYEISTRALLKPAGVRTIGIIACFWRTIIEATFVETVD